LNQLAINFGVILEECKIHEKLREELNRSHDIGTSLGPIPDELSTIHFINATQIHQFL